LTGPPLTFEVIDRSSVGIAEVMTMCQVGRRLLAKRAIIVFTAISLLGLTTSNTAAAGVSGENGSIAFVGDRDGNNEIYTMAPDGSSQVNLTNNPADDGDPDWSPDGRLIAFVSNRGGSARGLHHEGGWQRVEVAHPGRGSRLVI